MGGVGDPPDADESWPEDTQELHQQWWKLRIARQKEIDASIAARADFEYLYDKAYEDKTKVRVAGPFTVESLSPHRLLVSSDTETQTPFQWKPCQATDITTREQP